MAAAGRVAVGALIGAAAAALFLEGVQAGTRFSALPDGPGMQNPGNQPTVQSTAAPGTLISATSAAAPTSSSTSSTSASSSTTTTSATTTTTTTTRAPVTTTTTQEPPPPPPPTTTTTTTTTRRPCGILWCP
ncbi:hypothetical protein ACFQV2_28460 [Actinokineospora soli]|uniref:Uncharacterized protein n=1 Tax=Actinokineospora soli TaxID=1048753 RepID=A0ABW2TUJ8_9PSEU